MNGKHNDKQNETKEVYQLNHVFNNTFSDVATAFWRKYYKNIEMGMGVVTIAHVRQDDDNKFTFVRRLDGDGGKEEYKVISYERQPNKIVINTLVRQENARVLAERGEYFATGKPGEVNYRLSVFKEIKNKLIRCLAFDWGVSRMEDAISTVTKNRRLMSP
ncbi:MAG: hypothetical protein P4M11_02595 [Candidatus Pacebacteria bacterium]|nr:hypothetical protein [Candidatus Paceibacterota bacterium]